MPITIQELIPSDTISQAVNKINFNFDQLLLNGGGPVGPAGPIGPTGPVGGRGLRGATWYHDPAIAPGTDPNTIIIATVEENDYYLQANGNVWEYNGTVWVLTPVNLTGPQGSSGSSFGFNYAGGYPGSGSINNQNVAYIAPMPGGTSSGAVQGTNEAVSVAVFGGIATTAVAPSGISFTNAFLIPDIMIKSLDSSVLSVLVHQKDSTSAGIKFMGGGAVVTENYEQNIFGNLSDISLGIDDALNINVPKAATAPTSISDLIGFNVNTLRKGQQYYAGKHINFISGIDNIPSGLSSEISDITFTVGTTNTSIPAKFSVATTFGSASALFELGGNITLPSFTTKTGNALLEAALIKIVGLNTTIQSTPSTYIVVANDIEIGSNVAINIETSSGADLSIIGDGGTLVSGNSYVNVLSGGNITLNAGINSVYIAPNSAIHSIRVDNASSSFGGVKLKGNLIWGADGTPGTPFTTSYRAITIHHDNIATNKPSIYLTQNDPGTSGSILMLRSQKVVTGSPIEYVDITSSNVDIYNTSGNAGFVGFRVSQTHAGIGEANAGVQVIARDTITSNVGTKFHAKQDTTSVYNRFQYVRKTLTINPLTAGIGSATGSIYTIPASSMDASFLDVQILYTGGPYSTINASDNNWTLVVPNGSYTGQRLNLHVIASPCRIYDGSTQYNWPTTGNSANIGIRLDSFAEGTSADIGTISTSYWNSSPIQAGEFYVELMWIGQTYTTVYNTNIASTPYSTIRGWVITNILSPQLTAGTYTFEAAAEAQVDMT